MTEVWSVSDRRWYPATHPAAARLVAVGNPTREVTMTNDDGENPVEWLAPWDTADFDEGCYRYDGDDMARFDPDVSSRWWEWPGPMGGKL